jgi:hypothetical protein
MSCASCTPDTVTQTVALRAASCVCRLPCCPSYFRLCPHGPPIDAARVRVPPLPPPPGARQMRTLLRRQPQRRLDVLHARLGQTQRTPACALGARARRLSRAGSRERKQRFPAPLLEQETILLIAVYMSNTHRHQYKGHLMNGEGLCDCRILIQIVKYSYRQTLHILTCKKVRLVPINSPSPFIKCPLKYFTTRMSIIS